MLNLHRNEKLIIALLAASLLAGLAVSAYRKSRTGTEIRVSTFNNVKQEARYRTNINSADVEELASLKGIGKGLARRIVDYRSSNGPFGSVDEIKNVKGIGEHLFDGIRDDITVE